MIRISRKSFEDWLKAEGLDDETNLNKHFGAAAVE